MDEVAFKQRTKSLALRVLKLVSSLPTGVQGQVLGKQVLRSATSVGANYRAACRARSRAEMVAKLGIVEEELDETMYWFELLGDSGVVPPHRIEELHQEANELLAMIVASIRKLRLPLIPKSKIQNPKSA